MRLYQAEKYAEAFAMHEVLAKEWDSRSQVLLGSALVHGSQIPRDIPRGIAWLRIAASESNFSPTTRDRAAEQLRIFEPALSGAALIRADAIAGELLAERRRQRSMRIDSAYVRLLVPGDGSSDDVKVGCALDTSLTSCRAARADLKVDGSVCRWTEEQWMGALVDGEPVRGERPKYPERGFRSGWEGQVTIAAHVDGSGWVCRATVADDSGFRELDMAALDAVRRWRFAPRPIDGQPTPYLFHVEVGFRLFDYAIKAK